MPLAACRGSLRIFLTVQLIQRTKIKIKKHTCNVRLLYKRYQVLVTLGWPHQRVSKCGHDDADDANAQTHPHQCPLLFARYRRYLDMGSGARRAASGRLLLGGRRRCCRRRADGCQHGRRQRRRKHKARVAGTRREILAVEAAESRHRGAILTVVAVAVVGTARLGTRRGGPGQQDAHFVSSGSSLSAPGRPSPGPCLDCSTWSPGHRRRPPTRDRMSARRRGAHVLEGQARIEERVDRAGAAWRPRRAQRRGTEGVSCCWRWFLVAEGAVVCLVIGCAWLVS